MPACSSSRPSGWAAPWTCSSTARCIVNHEWQTLAYFIAYSVNLLRLLVLAVCHHTRPVCSMHKGVTRCSYPHPVPVVLHHICKNPNSSRYVMTLGGAHRELLVFGPLPLHRRTLYRPPHRSGDLDLWGGDTFLRTFLQ